MRKTGFEVLMERVGAEIRAHRQAAKMTLEDLAYEAGVTVRHVHQIEVRKANPTLHTLYKLAQALGVRVADLLAQEARGTPQLRVKTKRKA